MTMTDRAIAVTGSRRTNTHDVVVLDHYVSRPRVVTRPVEDVAAGEQRSCHARDGTRHYFIGARTSAELRSSLGLCEKAG